MTAHRKPRDPVAHARQMYVWHHNSFLGMAKMAERNMRSIIQSPSTTPEAKVVAMTILNCIEPLQEALKTRVDP